MHVLFVLNSWGLVGGTERHAAVVIPALVARGHRVTVLCAKDEGGLADVPVVAVPELAELRSKRPALDALTEEVRAVGADVAFVSALLNVDALERLVDLLPVVRYVHDHVVFCPSHNKYREDGETCRQPMGWGLCLKRYWFQGGCVCFKPDRHAHKIRQPIREVRDKQRELGLTRRVARVLTNSHYMRDQLLQVGFRESQVDVNYYFTRSNTPDQPQGPVSEETQAFLDASTSPLVFTSARLTLPDKGVDYLITALGFLEQGYRAVIAGSGISEPWLRQKAEDEGLSDRVHFTGWLDSGGMESLYARADVVVCPSVWDEPFGLVGIEAMSHGKPVVAFRVGGIPEWLTADETGFLLERKDAHGMARAIDRLLADPELARALGARGREILAERFGMDRHVDGLEEALATAMD